MDKRKSNVVLAPPAVDVVVPPVVDTQARFVQYSKQGYTEMGEGTQRKLLNSIIPAVQALTANFLANSHRPSHAK